MTKYLFGILILLSVVRLFQQRIYSRNVIGWIDSFGDNIGDWLRGIIDNIGDVKNGKQQ